MAVTIGNPADATAIRPFMIPQVPETELEVLRARVAATRWPSRELVADRSQGVQLATIQELARYWTGDYDWRACETRLNAEGGWEVTLPVGLTTFPGEIFRAPRSWAEKFYPNLIYFHEAGRGGHFAAWEEPQLFSEELRAGFRTLR